MQHSENYKANLKKAVDDYFSKGIPDKTWPNYNQKILVYYRRWTKDLLGTQAMISLLVDYADKEIQITVKDKK